ncbi:60S ribosomal protein L31 [Candidatus Woesearchaeota archaeon]|nr:60S ribosomal protein L31 [Candidatus Woesearchaeota archaeon]
MAEKFERTYNVPLRRGFIRTPAYRKAKKAVSTLKQFIVQHTKADFVKIGHELNKKIWKNGIKNPPHHVKVTAVKEDNVAKVELEGVEFKALKPKKKEEKKAGLKGKLESLTKKTEGKEEKKEEKKTEAKKTEVKKEETKKVEEEK